MKEDEAHQIRVLNCHELSWSKILKYKYLQKVILAYLSKRISVTYFHKDQEILGSDYDIKVGPQQIINWMKSELGVKL